jgi:hypothetical protein
VRLLAKLIFSSLKYWQSCINRLSTRRSVDRGKAEGRIVCIWPSLLFPMRRYIFWNLRRRAQVRACYLIRDGKIPTTSLLIRS